MKCPHIGRQYRIKNKAAITLQCKLNGKLIAALSHLRRYPENIGTLGSSPGNVVFWKEIKEYIRNIGGIFTK